MDSIVAVLSGLLLFGALLGLAMIVSVLFHSKKAGTPIKINILGIGEINTKHDWLVVMVVGGLLFLFSINTLVQQSRLEASTAFITSDNTLTALLKSSVITDSLFQAQVKSLDKDVQARIILKAARILANDYYKVVTKQPRKFEAVDFSHVEQLIGFLFRIDRNNGHGLYFSGEVKHHLRNDEQRKENFYHYLEEEKRLPESETGGGKDIALCTSRVHGFCQQRTGWIQHTLANYFLEKAQNEKQADSRREYYSQALELAKQTLTNYPPDGFEQLVPTKAVEAMATKALQKEQ